MPEKLTQAEVDGQTDPTVAKQFDVDTPTKDQVADLYAIVDKQRAGLLTTLRPGVGPVARAMAVAKRTGPDFLFLANRHSQKFKDIEADKTAQVTFQDGSSQDWVSVTGTVTTASHDDPRIKDLYTTSLVAWFGDLGDGVHTGKAEDPRVALLELRASHIAYWKSEVGSLGFAKEIVAGVTTGRVAMPGKLRELKGSDIEQMRNVTT